MIECKGCLKSDDECPVPGWIKKRAKETGSVVGASFLCFGCWRVGVVERSKDGFEGIMSGKLKLEDVGDVIESFVDGSVRLWRS